MEKLHCESGQENWKIPDDASKEIIKNASSGINEYKDLLEKYIQHIVRCKYISYIEHCNDENFSDIPFTNKELKLLDECFCTGETKYR